MKGDNGGAKRVVVTGGAGFVGSNLAHRLLLRGDRVRVMDDLSRRGAERNLAWLLDRFDEDLDVLVGDVRDPETVERALADADTVFHLAGQVAVTTSLVEPRQDFETNALGTLNILEALRKRQDPPALLFSSTNKVYGQLEDLLLKEGDRRYEPVDREVLENGLSEKLPLALRSPYGCSKGTADQYVLDYAATFGLRAVVFRMSCIYGPRQFGTSDQGWVAHFADSVLRDKPITIYGDGRQVRDILFVEDLVDAFLAAEERIEQLAGCAFNVGGGVANAVSLLEVVERLSALCARSPRLVHEGWRAGDQRYFVTDHRSLTDRTGWRPAFGVEEGLSALLTWCEGFRRETKAQRRRSTPALGRSGGAKG